MIVSGYRKGVGSSRETAVQAEKWSGIRIAIAASFAPIHARNNITQGVLMGDHAMLRAAAGAARRIPLAEFAEGLRPDHAEDHRVRRPVRLHEGLRARRGGGSPRPTTAPRPMTLAEKILARHVVGGEGRVT